ncbi:MAG TPA: hypothetical protein VMG60_06830 [Burkholderiaceae bacterium]|nr:hypothetical protein [Burkholderiaceae bacterium]
MEHIETEGDLARGMGLAIGMLIALFAVGIALFVLQQGAAHSAQQVKAAPGTANAATPVANPPPASAAAHAPQ